MGLGQDQIATPESAVEFATDCATGPRPETLFMCWIILQFIYLFASLKALHGFFCLLMVFIINPLYNGNP